MKRIILTDTHIRRDGTLFLQWQKQISDDGIEWDNLDYHRASVSPTDDIDAQIALVDEHVKSMGFKGGVDQADIAQVKAHVELAVKLRGIGNGTDSKTAG